MRGGQSRGTGQSTDKGPPRFLLLACSLILIGGSGLALAWSIKSFIDERRLADLWIICFSAVMILIGLLVIWIECSHKSGKRAGLDAETLQARLFGHTPQAADARAAQEALHCEKCGRPLGPDLQDCPYHPQGTCPYDIENPSMQHKELYRILLIGGSMEALIGLLFARPGLRLMVDWDESVLLLISFCATPLGLLAAVIGGLALYGERLTVTNKATGQMWHRQRIGGFTTYQTSAAALQPVAFSPQLRRPMRVPASICALYQSQDATHVFYMTLLSLLCQRFITLQCAMTSITYLGIKTPLLSGRSFVSVPGQGPLPTLVAGNLEERIVHTVREWSQRTDEYIRLGHGFRQRAFRHFLTLEDLVYVVLEGEQPGPGYWLTHDVVGADAVQRGLGRMVGPLKSRFEPLPEYREHVLTEYDVILEVHDQFKASQPDIASELWANIKKHIELLEPDD